jgi:hypothetical protein
MDFNHNFQIITRLTTHLKIIILNPLPHHVLIYLRGVSNTPEDDRVSDYFDAFRRLEYSYPSVLATPDGWVHITFTWSQTPCRRCAIRYHRITEEWVKRSWQWGTTR